MTKIVELRAENFARLKAVSIRPDGALVELTGKNSQGKTSCLNAIWTACKGRAVAPPQPIRKGSEEARISLDLGEMVITRTFKRREDNEITHDLKVTMANGGRVGTKPQTMIDALLGDLSFNPLEFARLKPAEQFERVRNLVPNFDFDENARKRLKAFGDRTDENRKASTARSRASGVAIPPGPKPKPVDISDLATRIAAATTKNAENERLRTALETLQTALNEKSDELERLQSRMMMLQTEVTALTERIAAGTKIVAELKDEDVTALTDAIERANEVGDVIRLHEQRAGYEKEASDAEHNANELTILIDNLDGEKRKAITDAKMPVTGLSFGEDEVLLNGLPFSQAGTAEKLKASIGIAMALNPKLRVMLIDEGSELDSESLSVVSSMAAEHDYQVWVARVAEGDAAKAGFQIVDGEVAE